MTDTPLAILFPGQGSQEPGMGRDVAEASSEAMDLWKKAEKASGAALREIYWDGDAEAMAQTRYLQPALTVVNLSLWAEASRKVKATCFAGHSLGEFSALAAANVLPVSDVLDLVALRGRLMAEADPDSRGAMSALIKIDQTGAEQVVAQAKEQTGKILLIANYNSPAQYVISGEHDAVEAAGKIAKEKKARAVPLPVSGAFHSPLMAEAATELKKAMDSMNWSKPATPVYFNVTAGPIGDADEVQRVMGEQMTSSVRWIETIANQYDAGVRSWMEVGPKNVLAKLLGANLKGRAESDEWTATNVGSLEAANCL